LSTSGGMRSYENAELAPEQRNKEPLGPYTDVYALGIVLYQLLTGKTTFTGATPLNNVTSKYSQTELPSDLNNVITIALAQDPKLRYQRVSTLANAYHQAIDQNKSNRAPFVVASSPPLQPQQPFVTKNTQRERQITAYDGDGNNATIFHGENDLMSKPQQTSLTPHLKEEVSQEEDFSDSPTLKKIHALPKQSSKIDVLEELNENPTPARAPVILKQASSPIIQEELDDDPTPIRVLALPKQMPFPATREEDAAYQSSPDQHSTTKASEAVRKQITHRLGVIALLLLLLTSGIVGIMLIIRQYSIFSGLTNNITFLNNSGLLLGLCIALAVGFTVSFNIISRMRRHIRLYGKCFALCLHCYSSCLTVSRSASTHRC